MSFVEKNLRRNYTYGILNGAIFGFVDAISAPSLVLALFIEQLGASNFLIGLLPAIVNGGWFLPQFFISHRLQQLPLKKPVYTTSAVIRVICWAIIVVATFALGASRPTELLVIFFVLITVYSFAAGFAGNAFMTMVGKIIPMHRRGSFFGLRELTGTAMGLFAGYLVAVALSPQRGLEFPNNFGILFVITFGTVALGLTVFALVREPRETTDGEEITFLDNLDNAKVVWGENRTFRLYVLTRVVLAAGDLATPFYAIYATQVLGVPAQSVGVYIAVTTLAALVSNPLWSWLSDRHKSDVVMVAAAAAAPILPLLALMFGALNPGPQLALPFALLFAVYGAGRTAGNIVFPTYLLNLAPPAERTLYIGLTNTLLGFATFIPIVGGVLLDLYGFQPLFVITFLASSVGLALALRLLQPVNRLGTGKPMAQKSEP